MLISLLQPTLQQTFEFWTNWEGTADLTLVSTTLLPGPATTRAQIAAPGLESEETDDSAETDEDVVG